MLEDGQVAREIIWALLKAKNSGRQTFGFSSGQMLRSSLILSKPLPLPLGRDIFRVKRRQSPGRFQSMACFAAGWTWNSSATAWDSLFSCRYSKSSDLCTHTACTRMHTHTPEQTSSLLSCWGGFSYSLWSQRFHLSLSDSEHRSPACLLPLSAPRQKKSSPSPPSLSSTHNTKSKNQPKLAFAAGTYQPEHTHVGHPWELGKVLDQRERWWGSGAAGGAGPDSFFIVIIIIVCSFRKEKEERLQQLFY